MSDDTHTVPGLKKKFYNKELRRLQLELVKLQSTIRHHKLKVVVLFEGRDAAGKGGAIKRITQALNPRVCRVVALSKPTERERSEWYFQRYVEELPAAGEMVLFDRSWYNRSGVERVMGFATEEQVEDFFQACPDFERLLVASDVKLIKYWFSVSAAEQERRFMDRMENKEKRWKLSPMDFESRLRWDDYSRAKDEMLERTDIEEAPWYVIEADSKRRARLNCIRHLLAQIPYEDLTQKKVKLPPRTVGDSDYVRPPIEEHRLVKDYYAEE